MSAMRKPHEPQMDTQGGSQGCGSYVPGYVPVAIDREVVNRLRVFRREKLNVDLRIERAMVSSATEICLADEEMREQLKSSTHGVLRETTAETLEEMTSRRNTAPVLIRRNVKRELRSAAGLWNLSGADETINNVMVSAAISLILMTERLHEKWIQLTANTVGTEVQEGFQRGKNIRN